MKCPVCGGNTEVYRTSHRKRTNSLYRRRSCVDCGFSFSTEEISQKEYKMLYKKYELAKRLRELLE